MSEIIKIPGGSRPTKKAGTALISATLDRLHAPLSVAGRCRSELRDGLRNVSEDRPHCGYLESAMFNHNRMLSRAAMVSAAGTALFPVVYPNAIRAPTLSSEDTVMMLAVLFGTLGKKSTDNETLMRACVAMFDPESDIIGEATGLWTPVSRHPVVLALAIKKLMYDSVFTSVAELRGAMQEALNKIRWLWEATGRWQKLLQASDRCVFEHDRAAWDAAYANVGADVVLLMQYSANAAYEGDDDDGDGGKEIPPLPRWSALEALRLRKQIE